MAAIFVMLPIYIIYIDIKHPLVTHGYPCQHLSPLKIKIEASSSNGVCYETVELEIN